MIEIHNLSNENEMNSEIHNMNSFSKFGETYTHTDKEPQETKYQCPMNCEGSKTYNQPGECPVCNMQLVIVGIDEPKIHVE